MSAFVDDFPNQSEYSRPFVAGRRRIRRLSASYPEGARATSIGPADRAVAFVPAASDFVRSNMVRKEGLEIARDAERADREPATAGRALHPLVLLCMPGKQRSWSEAGRAKRDVPISIWWDQPPGDGPR